MSTFSTGTSSSLVEPELVDADDRLHAAVDARLRLGGGFLDAQLGHAFLDGLRHAAHRLDFLDMRPRARRKVLRQPLDIVAAAPRIDRAADAGFLLQEDLRVARNARREVRRQRQRFVERIGVQRLRLPARRRHRLEAGADRVVVDVLRRQRPAGGLRVRAQRQRLVGLRVELLHQLAPTAGARRASSRLP